MVTIIINTGLSFIVVLVTMVELNVGDHGEKMGTEVVRNVH